MKNTATIFKTSDNEWIDESGTHIQFKRTKKYERLMERSSARILKAALAVNSKLQDLKDMIRELSQEAYEVFMDEKNVSRKSKGNFTWYNFDRSIKIEVNVNEPIQFDDLTITAAKEKFDAFLEKNIETKKAFIKKMVIESFSTKRTGKLDVHRVLNLTRYAKEANDDAFDEAVKLVNQAIRRPKTKTYFRVWLRDEAGKYKNVELNLSNI